MFDIFYHGHKPNLFAHEQPAETIEQAAAQCKTKYFWYLDGGNTYDKFDFTWQPMPWEAAFQHIFPTQWQRSGGGVFRPKTTPAADHYQSVFAAHRNPNIDVVFVDHGNATGDDQSSALRQRIPNIKKVRFFDSYIGVLKRIVSSATQEHLWIANSICDYTNFDFSWHPEQFQTTMQHVFASNDQKFGDTFYIHVPTFKAQMAELELLDWFNVNYCTDQTVPRFACPVFQYNDIAMAIKQHNFNFPYAIFTCNAVDVSAYTPKIWTQKTWPVEVSIDIGNVTVVSRESRTFFDTESYKTGVNLTKSAQKPLDIVYIGNGERDEQANWEHLIAHTSRNDRIIHRVGGINGRAAAYKSAAERSQTDWFFAVFAKLKINPEFNWNWQPDRQQPDKHYIFYADNPVNGLQYGHQGMIAYNKRLVLETDDSGLDFTLSRLHEVVPVSSGVAHFNTSAFDTWRTAFREVIKLVHNDRHTPNVENSMRLQTWLTRAQGDFAECSIKGAADAVAYYDSVAGDYDKLMLSYEWKWLAEYYAAVNRAISGH